MKTPLSRPAYEALVHAVGAANVSEDPGVVVNYAWNAMFADPGANKISAAWPSAVVLPGSTDEVQAVVKACNEYGIRFRAFSTGLVSTNGQPGVAYVILDLRRMNSMVIDADNMVAEIGPYVTAGQLQAEAMKHGLTCHIIGAGPPHSPLASATSMNGIGISGATTGINFRNLLSFEWVTPQGDVLRVGSAGCGAGWFSGEGPGPGFRGMIRGDVGTMGGLGVFTRIGFKLHPWAGPGSLRSTGTFPQLGIEIPEHFKVYHLSWKTWEAAAEAGMRFNASRVADFWVRIPPDNIGWILTASNNEFVERAQAGNLPPAAQDANQRSWTVVTMARSEAEARYKAKVMACIIADTGGREVAMQQIEQQVLARNLITSCYVIRAFRPTGMAASSMGILDSFRLLPKVMGRSEVLLAEGIRDGHFASSGKEGVWAWPNEGRYLWAESLPMFSPQQPASYAAAIRYMLRTGTSLQTHPYGINGFIAGPTTDMFGPKLGFANEWMRKVKRQYDPQNLSIPQHYVGPKKPVEAKLWSIGHRFLLTKWGAPVFKAFTESMFKQRN
jgi:glycolate oxidase